MLPSLWVSGTHSEVGRGIGRTFRLQIVERAERSEEARTVLEPLLEWVHWDDGKAEYDALLARAEDAFPGYVEELRAMAEASGVDFQRLFVLNTRDELLAHRARLQQNTTIAAVQNPEQEQSHEDAAQEEKSATEVVDHCSDYIVYQTEEEGGCLLLGHNEDGHVSCRDSSFLVTAHIYGEGVEEELWVTAFVYPGELMSNAFWWNSHGVGSTMNAVYPANVLSGGIGRNFVSRHMLGAQSMDDVIARVCMPGQATGHTFNLFSLREERCVTIETAPAGSAQEPILSQQHEHKPGDRLFVANTYRWLAEVPVQHSRAVSSVHRMRRAEELPVPHDMRSLCAVLGDHSSPSETEGGDTRYCIFRRDAGFTVLTALFNLSKRKVTFLMHDPRDEGLNANVQLVLPIDSLLNAGSDPYDA